MCPLGQIAWTIYTLEGAVSRTAPQDERWKLLFQMLWSFDSIAHCSYYDTLLLSILPGVLLNTPYSAEAFVDPPGFTPGQREEERYWKERWEGLSWPGRLASLPQNAFGYLHPKLDQHIFLGISRQTHDRLAGLYRSCPAQVLEAVEQALQAVCDLILDELDGVPGRQSRLYQAVLSLAVELPPTAPFRIYKRGFFQDLASENLHMFFLGLPLPRPALELPHIFY